MVARLEWAKDDRSKEFSLSIISDTQDIVLIGGSDIHEIGREGIMGELHTTEAQHNTTDK